MKLCDYICSSSSRRRRSSRTGGGGSSSSCDYICLYECESNAYAYVVIGHRVVRFLQVLETSPCRGGSVKIFN